MRRRADAAPMKVMIALSACAVLAMGAVVVCHERPAAAGPAPAQSLADVVTVSTGQRVDLARHVPRSGFTIVEFTADF